MAWQILRTTPDGQDDPDYVADGIAVDPGDAIAVAALKRSPEGKFAVRVAWIDAVDQVVNGVGAATLQLVTVDEVPSPSGTITLVSVGPPASQGAPPITGAREPMVFESMSMSGLVSIRCSDMTPPGAATRLRIYVETVDP